MTVLQVSRSAGNVLQVSSEGAYTQGLAIDTVGTANAITDGATGIAVTGTLLDTVTSAIIETSDSAYQVDVTASFSAAVGGASATFNHTRGTTPLTTGSYQLRLALSDGVATVYRNITVGPASGYQVIELAGALVLTDPESVFAPYTGPDPVVGDQYVVPLQTVGGAVIDPQPDSTAAYDYSSLPGLVDPDSHGIEWWSSDGVSRVWSSGTITLDQAPAIIGIVATTPGTVALSGTVSITAQSDQVVTVTGTPYLTLLLDDGARQANYVSGSGTTDLVFTYTVQEFEDAKNGVTVTGLELNGGTIQDAGGNNLVLPLSGSVVLADLIVDAGPDLAPTLGTPTVTKSSISLPISYAGTDLTGYEYALDGGAWTTTSNPLQLSGLTAETPYNIDVRAVSATGYGPTASASITTLSATDAVPDAFAFIAQTGVALSTPMVSNAITVTGVDAGVDVPVSVAGDLGSEYSVSTDGGVTYGGWTAAPTNVRLNYRIRVRHDSSPEYSSGGYDGVRETTLTVGGVSATFTSTTLADTTPPVISLAGGNQTVEQGDTWVEPGYTATDNADGDITANVVVTGTINTAVLGQQTLTYSVTDLSGNASQTTRTVTVVEPGTVDAVAPVISLVGGNQTLTEGDTWSEPGYTASDDVDGDLTAQVVVTGTVNTADAGTYTLTYTVSDAAGNETSTTRTVTVLAAVQYPMTSPAPAARTYIATRVSRPELGGQTFVMRAGEILDYDFDLTQWLIAQGNDTIEPDAYEAVENAESLTLLDTGQVTGTDRIKVWLSALTAAPGETYPVTLQVTTSGSRTAIFQFRMIII